MPATARKRMTVDQWRQDAERLFGPDELDWRWKCPSCGNECSTRDYRNLGAPSSAVGFSCIGRWWAGTTQDAFTGGPGPCNYAGGGLIRISPVTVVDGEREYLVFEFGKPL